MDALPLSRIFYYSIYMCRKGSVVARNINASRSNSISVVSDDSSVQLDILGLAGRIAVQRLRQRDDQPSILLQSPDQWARAVCPLHPVEGEPSHSVYHGMHQAVLSACANNVTTSTPSNGSVAVPGTRLYDGIYIIYSGSVRPVHLADYFLLNCKINACRRSMLS